jgi:hypothetical protein
MSNVRSKFEQWFRQDIGAGSLSYNKGRYANPKVNLMWIGWKAATNTK